MQPQTRVLGWFAGSAAAISCVASALAVVSGPRVIFSTIPGSPTAAVPEPGSSREFHWLGRPYVSPDGNTFIFTADGGDDPNADPNTDEFIVVASTLLNTGGLVDANVVAREGNAIPGSSPSVKNGSFRSRVSIDNSGRFMYSTTSDSNTFKDEMFVVYASSTFTIAAREDANVPGVSGAVHGELLDSPNLIDGGGIAYATPHTRGSLAEPNDSVLVNDGAKLLQSGDSKPAGFLPNDPNYRWQYFDTDAFFYSADNQHYLVRGDVVRDANDPNADVPELPYDDVLEFDGDVVIQQGHYLIDPNDPNVWWVGGIDLSPVGDWIAYGMHWPPEDPNVAPSGFVARNGVLIARTGTSVVCGQGGEVFSSARNPGTFFLVAGNDAGQFVFGGTTSAADPNEEEVIVWLDSTRNNIGLPVLRSGMSVLIDLDGDEEYDEGVFIHSFVQDGAFLSHDNVLFVLANLMDDEGEPLGEALLRWRICNGDVNGDGVVDGTDEDIIIEWLGEYMFGWCYGDLNGDGSVTYDEDHDEIWGANLGCDQSQ